jgi:glucosamine kinase
MDVWLGIDAGGSRSVIMAVDKKMSTLYKNQGGAIHARMMKVDEQTSGIRVLIDTYFQEHPDVNIKGLCVGIAGGGRDVEQTLLRSELESIYNGFPIQVTSNAHVAHAEAFKNGDGILIIAGTGSMVLGRKDKRWDRAGGYGFLIGDPAGEYRMGQESLFAICTAMDGGKKTSMTDLIKKDFDINSREDLILRIYDNTILSSEISPILLESAESGDDVARHIIFDNCTKLASQVALASETLGFSSTPLCTIGKLVNNSFFREALTSCLNDAVPRINWIRIVNEPALGACRLALTQQQAIPVE